ncbi:hypothetical protein [Azospirillum rugosum]|uniref:Uncharacterized protein n=1 Tax=Azospirillum rugosum TaxID=416170 RepID=A0ABS4SVM4_9PROT|nr:hypothetical protein [Azospirillum rugosum]MBP2295435.1 hypothetical protein [Azospirillum rugosum]MDQ0528314.1 hypothetical protein [Azospirillum rugosum]
MSAIDGLFGTASAATAKWKPISANDVATGTWKAVTATKTQTVLDDSVEVSGLAKSLTGVAGKVFASLGSKARAMLDGFVKSGQMTEKEVSLGLRSLATDAVKSRFMRERPQDEEDKAWAAKGAAADKALHHKMERMEKAMQALGAERDAAHAAFEQDKDQEAFQARMVGPYEQFSKETADINREEEETAGGNPLEVLGTVMSHFLKKGTEQFQALDFTGLEEGDEDFGLLPKNDVKGKAAADKMMDLGFIPKLYRNGLADYAADVDIPGVGRGTVKDRLPESEPSAAEEEAATGKAALRTIVKVTQEEAPGLASFTAVTAEARSVLDAGYAAMAKAGKGVNLNNEADVNALFGGFDRRSLFAIASNSGGGFSKNEQAAAQSVMARQQKEAMTAADPTGTDPAAAYRAAVAFLDTASGEEKASVNWSVKRAAAQFGYESSMSRKGATPERVDSVSPLARMLKGAMDAQKDKVDAKALTGGAYVNSLMDLPLFKHGVTA